jgi:hypothetical protein
MLCDKCSRNDVTLIPKNANPLENTPLEHTPLEHTSLEHIPLEHIPLAPYDVTSGTISSPEY